MTPRFQHFPREPDLPGHRDARIIVYNRSPHGGLTCFRNKVLSGYRDYLKRCHKSTALQCHEASTDVLPRYRPRCNFDECRPPAKDQTSWPFMGPCRPQNGERGPRSQRQMVPGRAARRLERTPAFGSLRIRRNLLFWPGPRRSIPLRAIPWYGAWTV